MNIDDACFHLRPAAHRVARNPSDRVSGTWESPRAPVHGVSLHDEGAEVAPSHDPWREFVGRDVWIEWRDRGWDWHGQRVDGVWRDPISREPIGLMLRAIDYRDADMGGWCTVAEDADQVHEAAWADIESIRLLTDEECRPPARDSRIANDGHLGGPDDDHYSVLRIQPIEVTEAWAPTWPAGIGYHLGEAVAAIARCGTKGQAARDLRKAAWLLARAADVIDAGTS